MEVRPSVRVVFLLLVAVVIVGVIIYSVSYIFASHGKPTKQITPIRSVPQQPLPQQNVPTSGTVSWVKRFPAEMGHTFGIACPTSQECFAVGRTDTATGGIILSTTDSGRAWREDTLPEGVGQLSGIACPTSQKCFAVGLDIRRGALDLALSTIDAGNNWSVSSLPATVGRLDALSCPSANECVVVGGSRSTSDAVILVSNYLGTSWINASIPQGIADLESISCPTVANCIAVGNRSFRVSSGTSGAVILATTDAGANWVEQSAPSGIPSLRLKGVTCINASRCIVVGYATVPGSSPVEIATTDDGGEVWSLENVPAGTVEVNVVTCASSLECFAAGCAIIMGSNDGGTTWSVDYSNIGTFYDDFCSTVADCLIVGYRFVMVTRDSGNTWLAGAVPALAGTLSGAYCTAKVCVAVGSKAVLGSAVALYSSDGGRTWQAAHLPASVYNLTSVSCTGTLDCVAVGSASSGQESTGNQEGSVVVSSDGGRTWQVARIPALVHNLTSVSCMGTSDCVAVGSKAVLGSAVALYSSDGGRTWQVARIPALVHNLTSVSCMGTSDCVAVGSASSGQESTGNHGKVTSRSTGTDQGGTGIPIVVTIASKEKMLSVSNIVVKVNTLPTATATPISLSCPAASLCMIVSPAENGQYWDVLKFKVDKLDR